LRRRQQKVTPAQKKPPPPNWRYQKKESPVEAAEPTTSEPATENPRPTVPAHQRVKCHMCDHMASEKPGHVIEDGVVVQCPFITVNIKMTPAKPDAYR
jgi:hypothetical protein